MEDEVMETIASVFEEARESTERALSCLKEARKVNPDDLRVSMGPIDGKWPHQK